MAVDDRPDGLCGDCAHVRRVESSSATVYWRCCSERAGLGKYPRLPVLACAGHEARNDYEE